MTHFIRLTFSAIDEDVPKMSPKCPQNVPKNVTINVPKNETQKRREMIVNLIRDNNEISLSAIAKNLELNVKTVKRELAEMRHIVQHVGPTRGGHWEFL
jgi:ATP-dependent DNA helicase RecG